MAIDFAFAGMAAHSEAAPAVWRRPFWKWLDGIERGWAIPLLLIAFVAVWTSYLVIAYSSGGLHPDTLEAWTLGRTFEWGNPKHPPLMGWVTRCWTLVFPLTDWSLQLLAMTNSALALWSVDLISRRFIRGDKRALALLLLMLLPAYQFHAQRFNANSVLLAIWPLATYCFLRSYQSRRAGWAALAGVTAAIAMMGKYYSVFLVASFVFAAIVHPGRRSYFKSSAPWISTAFGLPALGPHLHWLATTGAMPFEYALVAHGGFTFNAAVVEALLFLLGLMAALVIPVVTWIMIAGYRLRRISEDFRTLNSGLWLLWLIGIGTIAFPITTCVTLGTDLPSLWALQGLFLFVVPVVAGTSYSVERFYSVNLTVLVFGIALTAAFVGAPLHAIYRNMHPYEEGRNFYRSAALELTRHWRTLSAEPLSAVSGDDALAFATAFYSPDHPRYARPFVFQYTWGLPREGTLEKGWAGLCFSEQQDCISWMEKTAERPSRFVRFEFEAQSSLLGSPGVTRRVTALIVPPRNDKTIDPSPASSVDVFNVRRRD